MEKQGKVQIAYMFTNPRAKQNPAKHNLWKNDDKKLEEPRITMQKSWYFLEHYLINYEFWKMKKK